MKTLRHILLFILPILLSGCRTRVTHSWSFSTATLVTVFALFLFAAWFIFRKKW